VGPFVIIVAQAIHVHRVVIQHATLVAPIVALPYAEHVVPALIQIAEKKLEFPSGEFGLKVVYLLANKKLFIHTKTN
jgi:hypothetical protein